MVRGGEPLLHPLPAGERFQCLKQNAIISLREGLQQIRNSHLYLKGKATPTLKKPFSRSASQSSHDALALALDETQKSTNAFAVVLPARATMTRFRTSVNLVCVEKKLAA